MTKVDAGRLHVVYGANLLFDLPEAYAILTNRTISGSGDFLVNIGTGRPSSFLDADLDGDGFPDDNRYVLRAGEHERWYRFTTLGDGQAGEYIRLAPVAVLARTEPLRPADVGSIAGASPSFTLLPDGSTLDVRSRTASPSATMSMRARRGR